MTNKIRAEADRNGVFHHRVLFGRSCWAQVSDTIIVLVIRYGFTRDNDECSTSRKEAKQQQTKLLTVSRVFSRTNPLLYSYLMNAIRTMDSLPAWCQVEESVLKSNPSGINSYKARQTPHSSCIPSECIVMRSPRASPWHRVPLFQSDPTRFAQSMTGWLTGEPRIYFPNTFSSPVGMRFMSIWWL